MSPEQRKVTEHAVETAAFLSAVAVAGVALLPGMGVPGWMLPVVWFAAGTVAALTVWGATGRGALSVYCATLGGWLGVWTIWAEVSRIWDYGVLTAWVIGVIIFCPWAAHAAMARVTPPPKAVEGGRQALDPADDAAAAAEAAKLEEMAQFAHMFRQIGIDDVEITDLARERSGRKVRMRLPNSGKVTIAALEQNAKAIEVILRLKPGCAEFYTGEDSSDVVMKLREHEVLAGATRLRPEYRASTINEPFAIGIQEDGSILKISLRELHLFLAGTTGAGKSNVINVLLAQLGWCVDTLIWVIDMKGGRTAKPWLQAWIEGKADAPVIDWVATTRDEAVLMATAFKTAIEGRANSGIGGSKIKPKPSMPQIIMICDEMAELVGNTGGGRLEVGPEGTTNSQLLRTCERGVQKARSEACTSIWATQRGTNDMAGSGTLKSLCKLRLALGAATASDLQWVIPDATMGRKQLATMATTPGIGVVAVGSKTSQLSKFFYHDHLEDVCWEEPNEGCVPACPVYQTSIEVGGIRPRLDKGTAAVLGEVYSRRWERAREQPALAPMFSRGGPPRSVTAVADVDTSQFEAIVAGITDPEDEVSPVRRRVREILAARRAQGATPKVIRDLLAGDGFTEGRDYARETLQRWLRQDEALGIIHQEEFGRWVIGRKAKGETAA